MKSSSELVLPKCSHFGVCGGCCLQDMRYSEQIVQKHSFVKSLFNLEPLPILSSESHWMYRNKMEFSFSESKDGKRFLGLIQKNTRGKVVQLDECFLTTPWFVETLKKVYSWWKEIPVRAFRFHANTGVLKNLTLREGHYSKERMLVLTISGNEEDALHPFLKSFTKLFTDLDSVILRKVFTQKSVPTRFEEEVLWGKGFIYEFLHDETGRKWKFKIRSSSFFQPNTKQAEILLQQVVQHVDGKIVFDLYCGTGSIGIFVSPKADKVVGIEINPDSISDAKDNLKENGVTNMDVYQGDVEKILDSLGEKPDIVIVDPPRAGLSLKTIEILKKLNPKKILYVSCNPVSQVQNCLTLGYKIVALQPIDQFPHTSHIENLAILVCE